MKNFRMIFTFFILIFAVTLVSAQTEPPTNDFVDNDLVENDQPMRRGEIIARELGLTKEQQMQIRQINQQRRPQMQEAQQRFRTTKAELDELIYADEIDEATIQAKVRAVVEAQAEITKIRTMSELAVRNVLTPEQLVKFRDLRDRFMEQQKRRQMQRQRMQNRRQMNDRNPNLRPRPNQNRNRP